MVKKVVIAAVAVVLVAGLAVYGLAANKPEEFHVQRSIYIKASPEKIYTYMSNFHNFTEWSPYERLDPQMKRVFKGPDAGKGAAYEWSGKGNAGEGRMEIVDATEPTRVSIKLHFIKPFEANNTVDYAIEPTTDETKVTWSMHGPNSFMSKLFQVFFDMDAMCGNDFELGLGNLKRLMEKS